ncbi:MAG: hypothetical protein L3K06_02415 [Thermoplasmata archaeon]|nr:hypothetical protein [Thermoplasmata archaeon]
MQASAPPATAASPSYYPSAVMMAPRRPWRPIAGAIKMTALILNGIGIIVSGVSIGFLVNGINNPLGSSSTITSFLNTLEAGIIISGVGAILLGVGLFLESLATP